LFFGLSKSIQTLNAVSIGYKAADLVLENCSLVNVYSREINRFCPKCNKHVVQKVSIYKAGKRRGTAAGERRHALRKKGYGGQKFPKLAKPAKTTKKVVQIFTCPECKKKTMKYGIRIRKFELVAK